MYILKCKILKLDSSVTFKRFYNPPTFIYNFLAKKTWSKQNPLFKTPRPLVEPYNLGRLHPDKEWWNLPKKGLKPDTFMGFPDVLNIEKHGGSLYTHCMDSSTLSMVVYRCIDNGITDIEIWNKLTLQALKLAMSLDTYVISILFLYFSLSCHYDHKFVSTFVGRILATLDQFTLEECSNVILAMDNPKYYHEGTFNYVMKHAENICLKGNLNPVECLRFLSSLKNVENVPQNCFLSIGNFRNSCETIEVSDLSVIDKVLVFDGLESCCRFHDRVGPLCSTRLYNECCGILESSKDCNHYFNLIFLNSVITFNFKNEQLLNSVLKKISENVYDTTIEEKTRYLYLLSKLINQCVPNINNTITNKATKLMSSFEKEVSKKYQEISKNDTLWFELAVYILNSNKSLDALQVCFSQFKLLKFLDEFPNKSSNLSKKQLLELYSSLSKTTISPEICPHFINSLITECWNLEDLSLSELSTLLDYDHEYFTGVISSDKMDSYFNVLIEEITNLSSKDLISLIKFSSKDVNYSNKLVVKLKECRKYLYKPNAIVEVIKLYKRAGKEVDEFIYELLDGTYRSKEVVVGQDKKRLIETLRESGINYKLNKS
ncbi:uncharacterized protein TA11500 [Theileria annulata]|uniref:Uncharacterized protein n=1 Tax=Theileria annulata TaxID=5874 RepID=Q4UDI7_THEAN|nr:uncharacterized protein TA11500 [Theileria annulata]CAI74852.1 hypothetical protein, conserved [Theileria annulata]|eukprot:XP_952584.1 hypothetical protein, conserved [Theileria annulata]